MTLLSRLSTGISTIFTHKKLDAEALAALEELLIEADMGPAVAAELAAQLEKQKFGKEVSAGEIKSALAGQIAAILAPCAAPLALNAEKKPHVILMIGVNGNGKTTTIGKLASQMQMQGKSVMLAAADTFRAAAVEQLQAWGARIGAPVITGEPNADPASVAYRALEQATAARADALFIDTAGRLHNKANLMAELQKLISVIKKIDASAPHSVIQVLDATTGGNAIQQVETFRASAGTTGLIVTKLDGTAKGGVIVALAKKFGLPVHAVGVGEGVADLHSFDAQAFARQTVGLSS